jgi:hypothetical protein
MSHEDPKNAGSTPDEFDRLLAALFDGDLSDDQWNDLCRRMTDEPDARRRYIQFVQLHGLLQTRYSLHQHPVLPDGADDAQTIQGDQARELQNLARQRAREDHAKTAAATPLSAPKLSALRPNEKRSSVAPSQYSAWRIAAVLLFVASAVMTLTSPTWLGWWHTTPVATLADAVNAQWDEAQGRLDVGDHLPYGPLFLKSGYASIRLDNGVKLVVQGPAHFSVDSLKLAHLDEGKLTADVPHTASGYSVKIPSGMVTDIGTTFGVTAFLNKESTVQVLRGSVQAQLFSDDGKQKEQVVLTEDHAVALNPATATLASIPAEPDAYVTNIHRIPVTLSLHNTGAGLKPGGADPYWMVTANSADPAWKPRPAELRDNGDADLDPIDASSDALWIRSSKASPSMPKGCQLTFATTIDLTGVDPSTVRLHLKMGADDGVAELRLNGQKTSIRFPQNFDHADLTRHEDTIDRGFVAGKNTLEFVVQNITGQMGLYVSLTGTAVRNESVASGF